MMKLGLCLFMGYIVLVTADVKGSDKDRNLDPVEKENLEDLQIFTLRESGRKENPPKNEKKGGKHKMDSVNKRKASRKKQEKQKRRNGVKRNGKSNKKKFTKKKFKKRKNNLKRKKDKIQPKEKKKRNKLKKRKKNRSKKKKKRKKTKKKKKNKTKKRKNNKTKKKKNNRTKNKSSKNKNLPKKKEKKKKRKTKHQTDKKGQKNILQENKKFKKLAKKLKKKTIKENIGIQLKQSEQCEDVFIRMYKLEKKANNFIRKSKRSAKFVKLTGSKYSKQSDFQQLNMTGPLDLLVKCGGGNVRDLSCSGNKNDTGATQMKNLTGEIEQCPAKIKDNCVLSTPEDISYKECADKMADFINKSITCSKLEASKACKCFKEENMTSAYDASNTCNDALAQKLLNYDKSMLADKTKCTKEFGICRKFEDDVGKVLNSCCIKYCANGSYISILKQNLKSVVMNIESLNLLNYTINNNLTVVNATEGRRRNKRFNITINGNSLELDTGSQAASVSILYVSMIQNTPTSDVSAIGTTIMNQMGNIKFTNTSFAVMISVQKNIGEAMTVAVQTKNDIHAQFISIYGTTMSPAAVLAVSHETVAVPTAGTVDPNNGIPVVTVAKNETTVSSSSQDTTVAAASTGAASGATDSVASSSVGPTDSLASTAAPTEPVASSAAKTDPVASSAAPTDPAVSSAAPTDSVTSSAAPTDAVTSSVAPTDPVASSAVPTDPVASSAAPTNPVSSSAAPTDSIASSAVTTDPVASSAAPTDQVASSAASTDPIASSAAPTDQVASSAGPTDPVVSSAAPTDPVASSAAPTDTVASSASPIDSVSSSSASSDSASTDGTTIAPSSSADSSTEILTSTISSQDTTASILSTGASTAKDSTTAASVAPGLVFISTGKANTDLNLPIKFEESEKTHRESPVWKGSDGSFLFKTEGLGWVVGPTIGNVETITIKMNINNGGDAAGGALASSIPMGPWSYRIDVSGSWIEDQFLIQTAIPTSGFDIVFKFSAFFSYSLEFKMTTLVLNGFPLYIGIGSDIVFLYVSVEKQWVIGTKVDLIESIFFKNPEINLSSLIPSIAWEFNLNGEWKSDATLVGLPQRRRDFSFESTGTASASLGLPLYFVVINYKENGFDVSIGSDGSFLFVNDANNWVVGLKIGESSSIFMQNLEVATAAVPSFGWQYRAEKSTTGAWLVDAELVGKPMEGHNGPVFSSSGLAGNLFDMPIKFIITTKIVNGFPVYIGTGGFYLFVIELKGVLTWVIGTHIDSEIKIQMKGSEVAVIGSSPPLHGWLVLNGGVWTLDETLVAVVIPSGGFDLEFSLSGFDNFLLPLPFSVKLVNIEFNGFPVAITSHGDFMFVVDMGTGLVWVIGSILGDISSVWLKHSVSATINIPNFGWLFQFDGFWIEAEGLVSIPMTGFDLSFKSTGLAGLSLSLPLSFKLLIDIRINGFNVYIGSDGSFLFVNGENNWVVGLKMGDDETIFMINYEEATAVIPSFNWQYREKKATSGAWLTDVKLIGMPLTGFNGPAFVASGPAGELFDFSIKFTITSMQLNGFPVYIGSGGFFLFVILLDGKLTWVIGSEFDNTASIILKSTEVPVLGSIPTLGWLYFDNGIWKIDVTLVSFIIPTEGYEVEFSSSGPAGQLFDFSLKFTITSKQLNGFPVYSGRGGFYLFVILIDGKLTWVIGSDIDNTASIILKSSEVAILGSLRPTLGWLYLDNGEWTNDPSLVIVIIPTGGFDLEFSSSGPESFLLPLPFSVKIINVVFNGFPVAITSHGQFLFVMDMGAGLVWVVGSVLGDSSSVWLAHTAMPPSTSIPSIGWTYLFGGIWIEAYGIVSIPLTGFDISFKSTGPAKLSLGLPLSFKMLDISINGFNVYIGSDGNFLFVNGNNNWVVGYHYGNDSAIFMINYEVATSIIPAFNWKYRADKAIIGTWIEDSKLVGLPLVGFTGPVFTSLGPAGNLFGMSIKFILTSRVLNGFPVYIGTGGFFLFVIEFNGQLTWVIGPDIGSVSNIIMINSHVAVDGSMPSHGWLYFIDGEWKIDQSLVIVISIPTSGFDLTFSSSGSGAFLLPLPFSVKLVQYQFNGFPVGITSNGHFVFVMDMGQGLVWVIGSILGDSSSIWLKHTGFVSPTISIPSFGWLYLLDGIWIEAIGLVSIPLKGFNIKFESSGAANASLGLPLSYKILDYVVNGFPVYIGSDGSFLYVNGEGIWVIGFLLGNELFIWMKNTEVASIDVSIPSIGWLYKADKNVTGVWIEGVDLIGIPLIGFNGPTFVSTQFQYRISFSILSITINGCPAYIGSNGLFLFVTSDNFWGVGPKLGDSSSLLLKNTQEVVNCGFPTMGWLYFINGQWIIDTSLIVVQLPSHGDGGMDLKFMTVGVEKFLLPLPLYMLQINITYNGFPVFISNSGLDFLFVMDMGNGTVWVVGSIIGDAASVWLMNVHIATSTVPVIGWLYRIDGGHWHDSYITSIQLTGFSLQVESKGPAQYSLELPIHYVKTMLTWHGFPVYIGTDGSFLFRTEVGIWVIGIILGDFHLIWMRNTKATITVPLRNWEYREYKTVYGPWLIDSDLTVKTVGDFDWTFVSNGKAALGIPLLSFTEISKVHNGFPVLIGSDKTSFMFVSIEMLWVVGYEIGCGDNSTSCIWMKNTEKPSGMIVPSLDWLYKVNGSDEWVLDIHLILKPDRDYDIEFVSSGSASAALSLPISYKWVTKSYHRFAVYVGSDASILYLNEKKWLVVGSILGGNHSTIWLRNMEPDLRSCKIPSKDWEYLNRRDGSAAYTTKRPGMITTCSSGRPTTCSSNRPTTCRPAKGTTCSSNMPTTCRPGKGTTCSSNMPTTCRPAQGTTCSSGKLTTCKPLTGTTCSNDMQTFPSIKRTTNGPPMTTIQRGQKKRELIQKLLKSRDKFRSRNKREMVRRTTLHSSYTKWPTTTISIDSNHKTTTCKPGKMTTCGPHRSTTCGMGPGMGPGTKPPKGVWLKDPDLKVLYLTAPISIPCSQQTTPSPGQHTTCSSGKQTTCRPMQTTCSSGMPTTCKPMHTTCSSGKQTTCKPMQTTCSSGKYTTCKPMQTTCSSGGFTTCRPLMQTSRRPGMQTTRRPGRQTTHRPGKQTTRRPGSPGSSPIHLNTTRRHHSSTWSHTSRRALREKIRSKRDLIYKMLKKRKEKLV